MIATDHCPFSILLIYAIATKLERYDEQLYDSSSSCVSFTRHKKEWDIRSLEEARAFLFFAKIVIEIGDLL